MHRSENGLQVGDVHQAQLAHHAVNAFVVDPDEVLGIAAYVSEVRRPSMQSSQLEHRFGVVESDDLSRSRRGQRARGQTLPASDVEHYQTLHVAHQTQRAPQGGVVRTASTTDELVIPRGDIGPRESRLRVHDIIVADADGRIGERCRGS
jgi:hypothetical protein